jgi:hypothetical protein
MKFGQNGSNSDKYTARPENRQAEKGIAGREIEAGIAFSGRGIGRSDNLDTRNGAVYIRKWERFIARRRGGGGLFSAV